jgi:Flp pilus assembly protein TadD
MKLLTNILLFTTLLLLSNRAFCDLVDEGKAKYIKGDLNGAIAEFNKAIELNPNSSAAYNDRGT